MAETDCESVCVYLEIRVSSDGTIQACTPAEGLHSSQGSKRAHRKWKRSQVWHVGTWNVRSMVDTEGSVAIASRRQDGS